MAGMFIREEIISDINSAAIVKNAHSWNLIDNFFFFTGGAVFCDPLTVLNCSVVATGL